MTAMRTPIRRGKAARALAKALLALLEGGAATQDDIVGALTLVLAATRAKTRRIARRAA